MSFEQVINPTYNPDSNFVSADIYILESDIPKPVELQTGTISLLWYNGFEDVTLQTVDLNESYINQDKEAYSIIFFHVLEISNLKIVSDLTLKDTTNLNETKDVLTLETRGDNIPLAQQGHGVLPPQIPSDGKTEKNFDVLKDTDNFPISSPEEIHKKFKRTDDVNYSEDSNLFTATMDFLTRDPLTLGEGELDYSGGGNRLLPTFDNNLTLQNNNILPWDISCYTIIENQTDNLLLNSGFNSDTNNVPDKYNLDFDKITVAPTLIDNLSYKILNLQVMGSTEDTNFSFFSDKVPFDNTKSITASVYLQMTKVDQQSTVKSSKFKVNFYDAGDVLLTTEEVAITEEEMNGIVALPQLTVLNPNPSAVKLDLELDLGQFTSADSVQFNIFLPQIEYNNIPTTRILNNSLVSAETREADILKIQQAGNLNLNAGAFKIHFIPGYSGISPKPETHLVDTRDNAGLNGFNLYHDDTGKLVFTINDGTIDHILISSGVTNFDKNLTHIIKIAWEAPNKRTITIDQTEVASDLTTVFNPPATLNQNIIFGSETTQDQSKFLLGQIVAVEILRRFI